MPAMPLCSIIAFALCTGANTDDTLLDISSLLRFTGSKWSTMPISLYFTVKNRDEPEEELEKVDPASMGV